MTTVVSRRIRSAPHRSALETWHCIVDLLARGGNGAARQELLAVCGIACSMIADQALKAAPLVVTCDGPRTRVYCVYGEDSLDESEGNEEALAFDALKGGWRLSLPCCAEDLDWVQSALAKIGSRVTARSVALGCLLDGESSATSPAADRVAALRIDPKGFFNP